ncbi:spondin domain-containing protein [Winogradskyella sp.]|uniref:T9SS type A sorting domain-containing protein n=1 Tax=Winogradskyella sp. TaxID=1883156 RepID=UPI00262B88DB|nr:spondin domain-containing protein [Winogradskyella sp.]
MTKTTLSFTFSLLTLAVCSLFAQSTATYDISFTSTWNSTDHGTLPSSAHWSDLVGANHNSNITFWEVGSMATLGIEEVAERGVNTDFNLEVQAAINAGNAGQWLQQEFAPFAAISTATLSDITVSQDFPLLTLVSMIAPSPDWMIAINGLNLWDTTNNNWKDTFTVDLFPYDAGTEDGFGYSTNNAATVPQGVITNIAGASGYPFNSEKIGILTITLKSSSLSIDDFDNQNTIELYPNPNTTGKVTISNATALSEISMYDVLGKKVKQIKFTNNTNDQKVVDLTDLKQGIYIIRLTNNSGTVESKRLIIN